ncbi:MAG: DNA polymerase IV [Bryobacterales bacterium]|nr:DNA polymerase IV [Bryobacterales bacterium]
MRAVVHWDGDSFFASIEQAADRRLRGRPVAIGGARRGVVISASPEARRFGVRPGIATRRARRMCGPLIVLPGHFELYERFSSQIIDLCEETTPLVEPVAVGAAYLDLTGTRRVLAGEPEAAVARLCRTVRDWLRVSLSAGLATNKTVARIAARLRKPGAQLVVPPGGEAGFLAPLGVGWLPGVGGELRSTLEVAGIATVGDLARAPVDDLALIAGRGALALQRRAQGVDEEPVRPKPADDPCRKETTEFAEDVWETPRVLETLKVMLERLMARVRAGGIEVRRLTLALRYTDREESERSVNLAEPTALETEFFLRLPELLRSAWSRRVRLRAVTLRVGRVYRPSPQLGLFSEDRPAGGLPLQAAIDRVRRMFGESAVMRGYGLPSRKGCPAS